MSCRFARTISGAFVEAPVSGATAVTAESRRRQSPEQQRTVEHLRTLTKPCRFRIQADAEGFPIIPGRYGQIEWFDGTELAVSSDRPRLFAKLWAIPGVRRHQTGDREMRAVFPVEIRSRSSSRWQQ